MKRFCLRIACCCVLTGCISDLQAQQDSTSKNTIPSDSIITAGAPYYKARKFKRWLLGSNYRNEWTQPLKVKVLNLSKEMGGLTPVERGGGQASKSLRLEDKSGKQFVLRSIEKYPVNALPVDLRETFVKDLVKDGISASYPYGALSIPVLAEAAGVPHATPQVVYVPDDPLLKEYKDFANTLCLFEEREPGVSKSYNTLKVYEKLQDDHSNRIDQKAVLQARLLDLFIMDFDRHEDQWRWKITEEGKDEIYSPIPRDRDQAFFINNGFIPGFISRPWIAPQLQGFRAKAKNINRFNFNPRYFDRAFLNELSEEDWTKQATAFVELMTDAVIEKAIRAQPPEIFQYSGQWIIDQLKERRKYLVKEALQYYHFLAKEVDIAGSDKKEVFDITRNDDGSVKLLVYAMKKSGDTGAVVYNRTFKFDETKEIRVYGMGDEDRFVIHGNAGKTIKVRIIGGAGNDAITNNATNAGASKTLIYDLKTENNQFGGDGNMRFKLSRDSGVNELNRRAYKYNIAAPILSLNYNVDDGIYVGASLKYTIHGFRKLPFKIQQKVTLQHALVTEAFNVKYSLEAIDVIGKSDLLLLADIKAPNSTANFFRYGNETVSKMDGKTIRHYRARYNIADAMLLSRVNITSNLTFSLGPFFQHFTMDEDDNAARFISTPYLNGLDSASLFKTKSYIGPHGIITFDNRDNAAIPSRGILWFTTARYYKGLGSFSKNFTSLNTDFTAYLNLTKNSSLILALRFGGGMNFGDYEFFNAQYLSGTDNLRGFRRYRFAGDKMAFNNTELRIKIADFKTYLFPGTIGAIVFHDIGRVWIKGENSSTWHSGYGFGIWVAPLRKIAISGSLGYSKEDGLVPVASVGYQF